VLVGIRQLLDDDDYFGDDLGRLSCRLAKHEDRSPNG
jgi:hypothetical protein